MLAWILLVTLLPTACSGKVQRMGAPGESAVQGFITVRVSLGVSDAVMDVLIAAFQEKSPTYRVVKVALPAGDEHTTAAIKAGKVDVAWVINPAMLGNLELLQELTPRIQQDGLDLRPLGGVDQLRLGGKIYGLPGLRFPQMLVYNREMVKAAGVVIPGGGWSWDEFRVAAAKLTKEEGGTHIYGFDEYAPEELALLWLRGKTGEEAATGQDLHDALELVQTMVVDKSMPRPELTAPDEQRPFTDLLRQGKAAMGLLDPRALGTPEMKQRFAFAPLPAVPGKSPVGRTSRMDFGLAADTPHPEAAWAFLRFLCGPEGAAVLAKAGQVPAYSSEAVRQAWEQQSNPVAGSKALFGTTWLYPEWASSTRAGQLYGAQFTAINGVLSGQISMERAVANYERAREGILKAY